MTSTKKRTTATKQTASTMPPERFEVHHDSLTLNGVSISFQRTLRVSEEGANWLPPSFGKFPLRSIDPVAHRVPDSMRQQGGVLLPLYVREALWIDLNAGEPVAVQIGAGGLCVVSGRPLNDRLTRRPQNYVVLPDQPWIDGFKTAAGEVRQFVGVPPNSGLSVEEQLRGGDDVGGIQIQVWRLTPAALKRWRAEQAARTRVYFSAVEFCSSSVAAPMSLGAGGRIRQEIYPDPFTKDDWQSTPAARCWVHLVCAADWRAITGEVPPSTPITAEEYGHAGLPWFDYYDADAGDLPTSKELAGIKSIGELLGEDDDPHMMHPDGLPLIRIGDRRPTPVDPGTWSFPKR